MAETKTKKPPDYTETAENLCNPPEVKKLIEVLHQKQSDLERLKGEIPEQLLKEITWAETVIQEITQQIKEAIEQLGSFQDMEAGDYAVKYRRMTRAYHPEPLKKHFSKFAELCITEVVNVPALLGQIKGKLLTEEELKKKLVITETPQYAFFIR